MGGDLVTPALGQPRGAPLSGAELEARTQQVGSLIRCPVCQGSSVADSPSTMAQNMKAEVRELLARGYDQEQIISYFEAAYGEFIRLEPKRDGLTTVVWVAPVLLLLAGLVMVIVTARRLTRKGARRPEASPPASLPDDPELARQVLRIRELAFGWPGGVPPRGGDQTSNQGSD